MQIRSKAGTIGAV